MEQRVYQLGLQWPGAEGGESATVGVIGKEGSLNRNLETESGNQMAFPHKVGVLEILQMLDQKKTTKKKIPKLAWGQQVDLGF